MNEPATPRTESSDRLIAVGEAFQIDSDMLMPAFSERSEHGPAVHADNSMQDLAADRRWRAAR